MSETSTTNKELIEELFNAGSHFGYAKARRHPSTSAYIFGNKNGIEIFDLEKTSPLVENAIAFVESLATQGRQVLFVSGKKESQRPVREAADKIDQPYVAGRWIGGTLTNFDEISKRVARLEKLLEEKEKGLLAKYTKKERLLIDREITKLTARFGGIVNMKGKPGAVFVVDSKEEDIAVAEARVKGIPVIALASSDCDISSIEYPILANDGSVKSVSLILETIVKAYQAGAKKHAEKTPISASTVKK